MIDEPVESSLLYHSGDSNIGNTKKDRVQNNERLGERVRHRQQGDVHELCAQESLLFDDVDGRVDVVLACKLDPEETVTNTYLTRLLILS